MVPTVTDGMMAQMKANANLKKKWTFIVPIIHLHKQLRICVMCYFITIFFAPQNII